MKPPLTNFSKILSESTSREQRKKLLHMLISEITINDQKEIDSIKLKINDSLANYMNEEEAYPKCYSFFFFFEKYGFSIIILK